MGSTTGNDYPSQVIALLGANWSATNYAVSGQTAAQMQADAASQIDVILSHANNRITLIAWSGTNDLYFGASATTTYDRIKAYAQARKAAGWRVILLSVLPRTNSGTPAGFETDRQAVNASLRADFPTGTAYSSVLTGASYADYLVDVGNDATIGQAGQTTNTTYYLDLVHLTNAGYAIVAAYVKNAISLFP